MDPFWPEPGEEILDELEQSWSAVRGAPGSPPPGPWLVSHGAAVPAAATTPVAPTTPPAPTPPAAATPDPPVTARRENVTPPGPSVWSLLRASRFDPGHRGVLALVVVGLVAALLAGVLLLRGRPSEEPVGAPPVLAAGSGAAPAGGPEVVVAVAGKVRRPGLVRLPLGSRVDDAVRAAGGPLPGVDAGLLNLARKLVDGEQVLVGISAPAVLPGAAGGPGEGGLLDLNAAAAKDLEGLPGIGPVLAQKIVDWRTEHGRFASVDQLREVPGIGESKYVGLKAKVRV